jgi:hypothetical protein
MGVHEAVRGSPGQAWSARVPSGFGLKPLMLAQAHPHRYAPGSGPGQALLPSARTFGSIPHMSGHPWFPYRGLSPHKFTPMPGVHNGMQRIANRSGSR